MVVDTSALTKPAEALVFPRVLERELLDVIDDRTRQLLERRRKSTSLPRRGWLIRRVLVLADVLALMLAFLVTIAVLDPTATAPGETLSTSTEFLIFFVALPLWVVLAKLHGLYIRDEEYADHSTVNELASVFQALTIGSWVVFAGVSASGLAQPDVRRVATFWALAVLLVTLVRAGARSACKRSVVYLQNTVILGAGDVGQLVARKILQHPEYGLNVVGFVDDRPRERHAGLEHLTLLGSRDDLSSIVELLDVERVIVAFSNDSHEEILELVRGLRDQSVQVDIVPRLFEVVGTNMGVHTIEGVPLVGLPALRLSRSSRFLKRALDVSLAALGLLLLAPLFGLIALLIKLDSRGPVFFRQVRMGKGDRTFRIFKFRTMSLDADARKHEVAHLNMHARNGGDPRMFKVPDDPRITPIGRFLRRTSIDELPQLLNVLRGQMSLVGPRPLILDEDRFVTEWARKRLDLKPGITGLWQVLGRSEIPFEEMKKLDYLYVTNWSLAEDVRLILLTLPSLLRARRAY